MSKSKGKSGGERASASTPPPPDVANRLGRIRDKDSRSRNAKQKLVYKPLRPPAHMPGRPMANSKDKVEERQSRGPTVLSKDSELERFLLRNDFVAPDEANYQAFLELIRTYLEDSGVEQAFQDLSGILFSKQELPYNPYPGFARRFRQYAERFHMKGKSKESLLQGLDAPIENSRTVHICKPKGVDFVWGLPSIVSAVEPNRLFQYRWLLEDITPKPHTLENPDEFSAQVVTSLVGSCVFEGSMYLPLTPLMVRHEYLLSGPDKTQGVEIFATSVLMDLKEMDDFGTHILLGVDVPREDGKRNVWNIGNIHSGQELFLKDLSDAVMLNKFISVQCIFRLDPNSDTYRQGQKLYGLHFRDSSDRTPSTGLLSSTGLPLSTLFEGIFMKQSHAEAYLKTFLPSTENDQDEDFQSTRNLQEMEKSEKSTNQSKNSRVKSDSYGRSSIYQQSRSSHEQSSHPKQSKTSHLESDSHEKSSFYKHLLRQAKHAPSKRSVEIDGFRNADREGVNTVQDPSVWQMFTPVRSAWQKKLAKLDPQEDFSTLLHYVLLLALLDRSPSRDDVLVELYWLLHSRAGHLSLLMKQNLTIQQLISKYEGQIESQVVYQLFMQYKQGLVLLLDNPLQERPCNLATAYSVIQQRLTKITGGFLEAVPSDQKTLSTLVGVNSYCTSLMIQLVADNIVWAPQVTEILSSIKERFPDEVPRPQTAIRQQPRSTNKQGSTGPLDFSHGLEDVSIRQHEKQVITLDICIEKNNFPSTVAREAALIKYLLDIHLDEVWMTFKLDLLTDAYFPPNPFPRLVTALHLAAAKLDLCFEKPEKIAHKVLHGNARLEDAENHIFHIPGCDAHGLVSALSVLDPSSFVKIVSIANQFANTNFTQRKGHYRVALCLAVGGHTPLYGKMLPYLNSVVLQEYCYIRGPPGCAAEAIQLYCRMVYDHVTSLIDAPRIPVIGVFFGEDQLCWNPRSIQKRRKGFLAELERYCRNKEPIFLKAYTLMQWRYVPVIKHFKFHFINEDDFEVSAFYPEEPLAMYQNIFFDKEKAAFHFQNSGPLAGRNPFEGLNLKLALRHLDELISQARNESHWLAVHRWLLTRSLVTQGSIHIAESWRMLHSIAAQVEYVNQLNLSLQDLVQYGLDQYETAASNTNRTTVQDNIKDEFLFSVGRMAQAFREKVDSVCRAPVSMTVPVFRDLINERLQRVTERDTLTQDLYLQLKPQTIEKLEEVHQMLQVVQDSTSHDIHSICSAANVTLKSVVMETSSRPSSAASSQIIDIHQYPSRPTLHKDYYNDWEDDSTP